MKQSWLLVVVLGLISLALWEISRPSRWHNLSATQLERAQQIEEARRNYGDPDPGPGNRAFPLGRNETTHYASRPD